MQGADILQTVAELSVAFAGFTGVVVAFGRRPHGEGSRLDALGFKAMLGSSLQALLFSVLPFLLNASGLEGAALWRVASGFMTAGLAFGATMDVHLARQVPEAEFRRFDRWVRLGIPLFALPAAAGLLLNVLGLVSRPFAPYLGGLMFFLLLSAVMFVRLLTSGGSRELP